MKYKFSGRKKQILKKVLKIFYIIYYNIKRYICWKK